MWGHFVVLALVLVTINADCTRNGNVATKCSYTVSEPREFIAFSSNKAFVPPTDAPGKVLVGPGAKLLLDFRTKPAFVWYFDTVEYPGHNVLITRLGMTAEYNANVDLWFRCDWQSYIDVDGTMIYGMTINPGFPVAPSRMIEICEGVKPTLHLINVARVAYVSTDINVQKITPEVITKCNALGIEVMYVDDLYAKGFESYQPLHYGEAWGYLRPFPADNRLLAAKDIPVFDVLPLDLSVVSGVITSVFQTVNSHVNLKSKERNTPNMILLNYGQFACMTNYTNKPIHITVAPHGWNIDLSTPEEVDRKFAERLASKKWLSLYHETSDKILSYEEMCPEESPDICLKAKKTFGTKAANIAFLLNKNVIGKAADAGTISADFGYDLTPIGFGIPFQFFVDFVNYPPNAHLKDWIYELAEMEMTREPLPEERLNISNRIKQGFWNGVIPPHVLQAVYDSIDKIFKPRGFDDLKLRSSSNAEDLPGFDGAGLYDSFSANLGKVYNSTICVHNQEEDEMDPKSLECALKGVYGSLFNQRSIEERTFARFKHQSCVMGVAVIPRYKELGKVSGNSVGISQLMEGNTGKAGYTFSVQEGDNDVTNPEPGTVSETSVAIFNNGGNGYTWKTTRYATPVAGQPELNRTVLPLKTMDEMLRLVIDSEYKYCLYGWQLGEATCSDLKNWNVKTAVDTEFKFFNDTRVHIKQLREFGGKEVISQELPNVVSKCSWVNPSYFKPPQGENLFNAAIGKPATSSSNVWSGYAYKGNDGNVDGNYYLSVYLNKQSTAYWWEVDLQDDYDVRYLRLHPNVNYPATMSDFTYRLVTATGTNVDYRVQVANGPRIPHEQKVTSAQRIRKVRIMQNKAITAAPGMAFAELQVFAAPIVVGNPDDFILEERPDLPDCEWDKWSDWNECSKPCESGTQSRTRKGLPAGTLNDSCSSYDIGPIREERICNAQRCPINCKWNSQWTQFNKCEPCGVPAVQTRTREKSPAQYDGLDCDGLAIESIPCNVPCGQVTPLKPAVLCWTRSTQGARWTSYLRVLNDGSAVHFLTNTQSSLTVNDSPSLTEFTKEFLYPKEFILVPVINSNMDGSLSWTLDGKKVSFSTSHTDFNKMRCPEVVKLKYSVNVDPCANKTFEQDIVPMIVQKLFQMGHFVNVEIDTTLTLSPGNKCVKRSIQATVPATFEISTSLPENVTADNLNLEPFDIAYLVDQIIAEVLSSVQAPLVQSSPPVPTIDVSGTQPLLFPGDIPTPPPTRPPSSSSSPSSGPNTSGGQPTSSGSVPLTPSTNSPGGPNSNTNNPQSENIAGMWYIWVGLVIGIIVLVIIIVVIVKVVRNKDVKEERA